MNIEILKQKKNFKKQEYQVNPEFFWKIILYAAFILITTSVIYSFSIFMDINMDSTISTINTNDKIEKNRKIRIENFLGYFSDREKKYEDILNSPSPVVDPSI